MNNLFVKPGNTTVSRACEFFDTHFDIDGNPKNIEGQKLYDKHSMVMWWTEEQRWNNNDEENRIIDYLLAKISQSLIESTNLFNQLNYVIGNIRARSNKK